MVVVNHCMLVEIRLDAIYPIIKVIYVQMAPFNIFKFILFLDRFVFVVVFEILKRMVFQILDVADVF